MKREEKEGEKIVGRESTAAIDEIATLI